MPLPLRTRMADKQVRTLFCNFPQTAATILWNGIVRSSFQTIPPTQIRPSFRSLLAGGPEPSLFHLLPFYLPTRTPIPPPPGPRHEPKSKQTRT